MIQFYSGYAAVSMMTSSHVLLLKVPQSVRVAAFRKAALIRLSETLQEALRTVKDSKNVLLQSAQHANRVAMSQQVRQQMSLVKEVLSAIRHSSASAAHSSGDLMSIRTAAQG